MTQSLERETRSRGKDSAPAIEWITQVLEQRPGAQACDFAYSAGVNRKTIVGLLGPSPRPSLYSSTYDRIMSTGPEDVKVPRHRIIPGEPAKRIVENLVGKGWMLKEIADAAGIGPRTLNNQNLDNVHAETVYRLLMAKRRLDEKNLRGIEGENALALAHSLHRRVEALMVMGWSREEIARRSEVPISTLRTAKPRVLVSTLKSVKGAYEGMRFTPGGNEVTEHRAKRMGYAPWSAWPGGSIDVEDAVPDWNFIQDVSWRRAIKGRYST